MRRLLVGITLFVTSAAATPPRARDELLAADRALDRATEPFTAALTEHAGYLHPGAPLLRGREAIRAFLRRETPQPALSWAPAFADVSADGLLGYTYGWTRLEAMLGKYLACWRKTSESGWRVAAYVRSIPVASPDSVPQRPRHIASPPAFQGQPDERELMAADSAFAALSVTRGARIAFIAFSAPTAVAFGGSAHFTEGREAIGADFDGFPADAVLDWQPVAAAIAPSGDLGCTVGEASVLGRQRHSKYLTIWKRQADRSWNFVADGGNARPAPSSTGTPPPED
jgi:ketosteroid isomerase-like protein